MPRHVRIPVIAVALVVLALLAGGACGRHDRAHQQAASAPEPEATDGPSAEDQGSAQNVPARPAEPSRPARATAALTPAERAVLSKEEHLELAREAEREFHAAVDE